jgi:hypothetical protein
MGLRFDVVSHYPSFKIKEQPLSAVRDCFFVMFGGLSHMSHAMATRDVLTGDSSEIMNKPFINYSQTKCTFFSFLVALKVNRFAVYIWHRRQAAEELKMFQ